MKRFHLFEIEDQPWCPPLLRDFATDFLQFAISSGNNYAPAAFILDSVAQKTGIDRVIDLCSGGGGPWPSLLPQLKHVKHVTLTDLFANRNAFQKLRERFPTRIDFKDQSVSATSVETSLSGIRTLFTAFHHFAPSQAEAVLRDAVAKRQPIAIFETTERSLRGLLILLLFCPLAVLLATPWLRPFRLSRLALTYVIPVVPLFATFDGLVSCFRTYTVDELREMALRVETERYIWEAGVRGNGSPVPMSYLVGVPRPEE